MSLRERIQAAPRPVPIEVPIPEWGLSVYVRPVSALAFVRLAALFTAGDNVAFTKGLLAASVVDDRGAPVYDEASIDELLAREGEPVTRIVNAARRANGLGRDTDGDEDPAKKA